MNLRLWAKRLIEAVMYLIVIAVMGGLLAMCSGCKSGKGGETDDKRPVPAQPAEKPAADDGKLSDLRKRYADALSAGSVLDRLIAERDLAKGEAAELRAAADEKASRVKALDEEIASERLRRRQLALNVFAGICGFLGLVCIGAGFWIALARRWLWSLGLALWGLAALALAFAWILPWLLPIGAVLGVAVVAYVIWDWRQEHRTTEQLVRGVNRLKQRIPDYKNILREEIDSDIDRRLDAHRARIGLGSGPIISAPKFGPPISAAKEAQ